MVFSSVLTFEIGEVVVVGLRTIIASCESEKMV